MERTGGRGDRAEGHAGKAVGAVCASGQAHVLLFALRTAVAGGRGCLGSTQPRLCWVRAPHSFVLAVGAAAMLCGELLGGCWGWRSTRMTLFWNYVPVEHSVSLGYGSPEPVELLGAALLAVVLTLSVITLLGKELARKGARTTLPLARLGQRLASLFLPFFLSFSFLSSPGRFFRLLAQQRGWKRGGALARAVEGKRCSGAWQRRGRCRASRVPGRKGRPQPSLEPDEERKGMGTERAEWRPGRGHSRWESARLPPGRLCPSASPRGWGTARVESGPE